jgi:hypothetical protein
LTCLGPLSNGFWEEGQEFCDCRAPEEAKGGEVLGRGQGYDRGDIFAEDGDSEQADHDPAETSLVKNFSNGEWLSFCLSLCFVDVLREQKRGLGGAAMIFCCRLEPHARQGKRGSKTNIFPKIANPQHLDSKWTIPLKARI